MISIEEQNRKFLEDVDKQKERLNAIKPEGVKEKEAYVLFIEKGFFFFFLVQRRKKTNVLIIIKRAEYLWHSNKCASHP